MTRRMRRSVAGAVLAVLGLVVVAVVAVAVQADGQEHTRATTNDGGAWLLKRDEGYVGHVNRSVHEVTAAVSVADPGSDFDVDQAADVILVHDDTTGVVELVDDSVERVANPSGLQVGEDAAVHAVDGGALVVDERSLAVWHVSRQDLVSLPDLTDVEPLVRGEGAALSAATPDGHAAVVDMEAGHVLFVEPDGSVATSPASELTDEIVAITMLGADTAVVADGDGDVTVATPGDVRTLDATGLDSRLVLQQPGPDADRFVAVTVGGQIVSVPLDGDAGEAAADEPIGELAGISPLPPIVFGGCVYAVSRSPATFAQWCGGADGGEWREIEQVPLEGAGTELRLRLVNGWIWINDLDSGAAWVTSPERRLDRVEDWGNILSDTNDDADDDTPDDAEGEVLTEVDPDDPDAEIVESDEIDTEGPNRPPIARDDTAQTRVDRPIDVDVLLNDTDPNGDVLLVTAVEPAGGDALLSITPDGRGVQVAPGAGFAGTVSFTYTITDGRGGSASAGVTVTVAPSDGNDNRPPEAHNDIAATRKGRPTTFDVLANDTDPDGDALVLESVALADPESTAGSLVTDPSGQVVFTPDPNSTTERIELTYVVSDDFGATDDGTVVVAVRLEDANNQPDARNDAGVTTAGKPLRLEVLANDTDPDDDPLFVAQLPTLVRPEGQTAEALDLSLTPDGELLFTPGAAGTYVFNYSATDGEETDVAQIRVEVTEPVENRPPVAVRDDVVIPAGGTRLVRVLDNDGDPDGDVVGLVGATADAGLTVKEVDGVGYLVTVAPDAPARPTIRYQVSDGTSDPVGAIVVVAVTDSVVVDQPPVARADVVEVRAGGRVAVPVLANDYDPEGGTLEVASVTSSAGATTAPGTDGQSVDVAVGAGVVSSFTLSYTVADEAGNQASAFLDVRIVPADEVNRPPVARADVARTRSGVGLIVDVVANDSDPDGDIIAVQSIRAQPAGGTARVEDGAVVYTPADTFTGTDRLAYSLVDANGEVAVGDVLVGVLPVPGQNRAPEAFDDAFEAVAGSAPLVFDVRRNDADPDGDLIRVTQASAPSGGAVEVVDGGAAISFTPPAPVPALQAAPSEVAFLYTIDDGRGATATATVTVTVIEASEPIAPVAVGDQIGPVSPGQVVDVDLLANDLDPDGNPAELTVAASDPALAQRHAGVVTFTAGATSGRYPYTITDPDGLSATGELAVLVVDNRAPVVEELAAEVPANETVTLNLAAQASDPDGDTLFFACCDAVLGGLATVAASGPGELSVTFDPDDGYSGRATLSFAVDDQQGHTVAGAAVIEVTAPVNRPPAVTDGAFDVEAGIPTNIDLTALVSDPDEGDTLQFTVSPPSDGRVDVAATASAVRASASNDDVGGSDSFEFTATDSAGNTATGTVSLTVVAPSAPPPQAQPDTAAANQAQAVTIDVLANDIDPLGQGLAVVSVGASGEGTATAGGGTVTFTPAEGFFGTTSFIYRIRDGADSAERESEAQVTVDVIGQPAAPGAPTAVAGNGTATVNWAAPAANGAPIDDYEVRAGDGAGVSVGPTTGYTFSGLTNGQAVQFSVRAHNSAGWGPWSGPSVAVTPDIEPGRPAAPTVQFADGALDVAWSAPANEGSAIVAYDLQIGGNSSAVQRVGTGTTFRWEGLTNGQEYTFMVRAVNAKGEGEWSAPSAPEHPLRPPDAPGAPSGQRGDRFIDVGWTPPSNGGDPVIEYQVQLASTGAVNSTTGTSLRWSNLPNGQAQQFLVRARNRAGWGPWSAASAAVVPCGVPDQVGGVSAARGDGAASVSWSEPGNQGCAISSYVVRNSEGGSMTVAGGTTSATFGGLSNGTSYTFTVSAVNEVGAGAASAASNPVVPAGPPGAPTITGATPDIGSVALAWNGANANGSAITTYQVSVNGGAWRDVGTGTSTTVTGLANSTTYSFQVRAVNDVGPGAASGAVSATTPGEPGQVGGLDVSGGRRSISATWSAPPANGKPITSYRVDIEPGGVVDVGDRSHTFTDLAPGTSYDVRVQACNAVGCGPWSAWKAATTDSEVSVTISKGRSAVGEVNCSTSSCRWIDAVATGLTPGASYLVACHTDTGRTFYDDYRSADGNGRLSTEACYFGYPGEQIWVTIGSHRSNTITW